MKLYNHFPIDLIVEKLPAMAAGDSYIIKMYLIEKRTIKEMSVELSLTIPKTKQRIAKAVLELRRVSNDPDYIKAIEILKSK